MFLTVKRDLTARNAAGWIARVVNGLMVRALHRNAQA